MSELVKKINYAMSLRTPQMEALSYLDAITQNCDYQKDSLEGYTIKSSNRKLRR